MNPRIRLLCFIRKNTFKKGEENMEKDVKKNKKKYFPAKTQSHFLKIMKKKKNPDDIRIIMRQVSIFFTHSLTLP